MENVAYAAPFSLNFENHFLNLLHRESEIKGLDKIFVLVPSNLLGLHLKHHLALEYGSHQNIRWVTFVDLSLQLVQGSWIEQGRKFFPPFGEELLLEQLCTSLDAKSRFSEVKALNGFHIALKNSYHDLLTSGRTHFSESKGYAREVGQLFERYRKSYADRYVTTTDAILEAASLPTEKLKTFGSQLFCYGFTDFSPVQQILLQKLAKSVRVSAWVIQTPTTQRETSAFLFFQRTHFRVASHPVIPQENVVRLFSDVDEAAESDSLVRHLFQKIMRDDVPLNKIAILVRNPEKYIPKLRSALRRIKLPYYLDGGETFLSNRFSRSLLILFGMLGEAWVRSDWVEFLTLFPFQKSWIQDCGSSAEWDRWTKEASITAGLSHSIDKLERNAKTSFQKNFVSLLKEIQAALRPILQREITWQTMVQTLVHFVRKFGEEVEDRNSIEEMLIPLEELDVIYSPISIQRGAEILQAQVKKFTSKEGKRFDQDGIYVGSIDKIRGIPFDVIALLGVHRGTFPIPFRTDPLLFTPKNRLEDERILFELIQQQAVNELWLCTNQRSEPSEFIAEIAVIPTHLSQDGPCLDHFDWQRKEITQALKSNSQKTLEYLASQTPLATSTQAWITNRLARRTFTEYEGLVPASAVPQRYSRSFSPSDVSTFSTCPYQFFLSRILRLSSEEDPEMVRQLSPRIRGDLVHEILHRFYSQPTPDLLNLEQLKAISEECFEQYESSYPVGSKALWNTEQQILLADLFAFFEREGSLRKGMNPYLFEASFEVPHPKYPEISIRGRIDRVDLSENGTEARIIDYKSGSLKDSKDASLDHGKSVQLPFYLLALPTLFPENKITKAEGVLISTAYGSGFKQTRFSLEDLSDREDDFQTILLTVRNEIERGHFFPNPGKDMKNCKRCDFTSICGKSVLRLFEHKSDDPLINDFKKLEEIK